MLSWIYCSVEGDQPQQPHVQSDDQIAPANVTCNHIANEHDHQPPPAPEDDDTNQPAHPEGEDDDGNE